MNQRRSGFPLGSSVELHQLEADPHALLARLRAREPVSWIPVLGGWLITRHDLASAVMRDDGRFTVDDPRFSTALVVGPSMLSLDGPRHERQRRPFTLPFRPVEVRERFAEFVRAEVDGLIATLAQNGHAELRRSFAGPLAAATVAASLGLAGGEVKQLLAWYDRIVAGVSAITAGDGVPAEAQNAFGALDERLRGAIGAGDGSSLLGSVAGEGGLSAREIVSNAAVLLFGGIETTEGMIANAVLLLLRGEDQLARVRERPELLGSALDESLRLEPAAAVIDRYATEDATLGEAEIRAGDLVRISITAANRDPALFPEPDRFDLDRRNSRRHLAFAQGPHVCLGIHLARLEARTAVAALLESFPRLRLDPDRPAAVRGLVFRKPPELHVRWD